MKFPETLVVTALEEGSQVKIQGLAIVLELFAVRKNNYIIGPFVSDRAGQVQFTREECKRTIKADQEMFIMDYVDGLEDCKSTLEVRLHSPEHIARMLQQYKAAPKFWGKRFIDPPAFFGALEHTKNIEFESARLSVTETQLLANSSLSLFVKRRS